MSERFTRPQYAQVEAFVCGASSPLTCCAEAFHVRTSAVLDRGLGSPARSLDSGRSTYDSFANYDHATSSWKTSQTSFIEGLEWLSESWPRSGMTRNGRAFRLPDSGFPKRATECGLLPTLVAADAAQVTNGSRQDRSISNGLTMTDWSRLRLSRRRVPIDLGELMMGYPNGWTECAPSETRSRRRLRNGSDGKS